MRYGYRMDNDDSVYADPASRYQPEGPHGMSAVVDPEAYTWQDSDWPGISLAQQVIYELHVGTFTPEGTLAAAERELGYLAELGITVVELMPVAEFDGEFGWGYDGVNLFAPTNNYGVPDDLRRFVDAAHPARNRRDLGRSLQPLWPAGQLHRTVFRQLRPLSGIPPSGAKRSISTVKTRRACGSFSSRTRGYWIDEFHIDGLRMDAVQVIMDDSQEHVVQAIVRRVREAAQGRGTVVTIENELQQAKFLRPLDRGGVWRGRGLERRFPPRRPSGHDWAQRVLLRRLPWHAAGNSLGAAVGLSLSGPMEPTPRKNHAATAALDLNGRQFVIFLQNHDQVGNSPHGRRIHESVSPGRYRAMTAVFLLAPGTPLIFQGQEFSASSPFLYFADHAGRPNWASWCASGGWNS